MEATTLMTSVSLSLTQLFPYVGILFWEVMGGVQMQPGLNGYRSRLQCSLTDAEDLDLGCQQCMAFMLTPSRRITVGLHHSAVGY